MNVHLLILKFLVPGLRNCVRYDRGFIVNIQKLVEKNWREKP